MNGGALSPGQRERLRGYLDRRPYRGPETVHIDITNACNLDCVTCWNYAPGLAQAKTSAWKAQRMDAATFLRVLGDISATGAERIILSGGGEPFMHPHIHDFIAAVKKRGLLLTTISNGTLCDFEHLAGLGVDQLLINTSSACAATYATYHPNQGEETFERLVDGVASIRGRIAVNLVQVINALNAHELIAMIDLAAEVGARASFKLGDTPPGTEGLALDATQRQRLINVAIPQAIDRARTLGVKHNLDAFTGQLGQHAHGNPPPPCFAGYLYSRVYVDGRVFFCCEHIEVGHVDQASFDAIWTAPQYDQVRRYLDQGHAYPGCARCGKHDMNFAAANQLARMQDGAGAS
jgi:MoaA/NifB/PqqE/SkfB family radical SAM enzyme